METKRSKNSKSAAAREQAMEKDLKRLITFPFPCPNCDKLLTEAKLYCSEVCRQEAKFVRYVRSCQNDGRDVQPDVQEAIQIRLALILGGGYPEQVRQLSDALRQAVIERDEGRCRLCGKPGNQIDHIQSSSNELENLQLLCDACHRQKTMASFVAITSESHPETWAKAEALYHRIDSPEALRLCDAEEWTSFWRRITSERRQVRKARLQQDQTADASTTLVTYDSRIWDAKFGRCCGILVA